MLADRQKNRSIKKMIKRQFTFLCSLFMVIFLVRFYLAPVTTFESLKEAYLALRGVRVKVQNELEYAYFDNCEIGKKCHCRVLVHGIGDSFHNWGKILIRAKNDNFKLEKWLAINYPGTGNSKKLSSQSDYEVRNFSRYLSQKIQQICQGPVDIIANSLGAWVSLWWALENTESVRSLVLLNPVGVKADYSWLADVLSNPTIDKLRELKVRSYHSKTFPPDFVLENVKKNMEKRKTQKFITSQNDSLALDGVLIKIGQPTLILWGESDKIVPSSTHSIYKSQIKKSQSQTLKNCGHIPQSECFELTYQAIKEFYQLNGFYN